MSERFEHFDGRVRALIGGAPGVPKFTDAEIAGATTQHPLPQAALVIVSRLHAIGTDGAFAWRPTRELGR
jgi:hypothetical protein